MKTSKRTKCVMHTDTHMTMIFIGNFHRKLYLSLFIFCFLGNLLHFYGLS